VEGNIGAGKTTFLDRFSPSEDNVEVMAEPVDRWRDVKGNNLLSLMYEDPARYSLLFQTYVQLTMLQQHNKECDADKDAKIMERSLLRIDKILKMIVSDLESCKDPF
jgi:deoxyadenosine/deoxycytidine kinase